MLLYREIEKSSVCKDLGILNCFWIFMTWNLLTSLCIELIIKIKRPLSTAYSFRIKVYLICTGLLSLIEVGIVGILGDFGISNLHTCSIKLQTKADYLYMILLFGNLPIIWTSMIMVLCNPASKRNKAMQRLTLTAFSITITWGIPSLSPLLFIFSGSYNEPFDHIAMILGCVSGIMIFIARLGSPQILGKIIKAFSTEILPFRLIFSLEPS